MFKVKCIADLMLIKHESLHFLQFRFDRVTLSASIRLRASFCGVRVFLIGSKGSSWQKGFRPSDLAWWRTRLYFSGRKVPVTFQDESAMRIENGKDAIPFTVVTRWDEGDRRPGGRRCPRRPRSPSRRVGPSVPDIAPRPRDRPRFAASRPEFFVRTLLWR